MGGSGECSNLELLKCLLTIVDEELGRPTGTSLELITFVKDRPGHDFRYAIDAGKLTAELGWAPKYTLTDGLRKTVQWYLSNESWLQSIMDESYKAYMKTQYGAL